MPPESGGLEVLAFAVPDAAIVGERVVTFGALRTGAGDAGPLARRLVACSADAICELIYAGTDIEDTGTWHGRTGSFRPAEPGEYHLVWQTYADVGLDGGIRVAGAEARLAVHAAAP